MKRFLCSTALGLALGFFLPVPSPVTGIVFNPAAYADETGAIPDWIKSTCCGPKDVHRLRPEQVSRPAEDYYIVDGYTGNGGKVNAKLAEPSQDGNYWIFYQDYPATPQSQASQSAVYCFFVPMAF